LLTRAGLARSQALESVLLDGNGLAEIPREMCRLPSLTLLDLSNNALRRLPNQIGLLTALEKSPPCLI